MKILDKLTTYASLIGVVVAIGGGFYAWGEFNTKISVLEKQVKAYKSTDLTGVNNKISDLNVDLLDRISALQDKMDAQTETDLSAIEADLNSMKELLTKLNKDVEISKKVDELQDQKIESLRLKTTNPLNAN